MKLKAQLVFKSLIVLLMFLGLAVVVLYQPNNYQLIDYVEISVDYGDTLWAIAKATAPAVDPRKVIGHIKEINNITNNQIFPGQTLQVPKYQLAAGLGKSEPA